MTGSLTKIALAALAISVGTVRYSFAQAPAAKDTAGAATAKRSAEAAGKAPAEKPIEGSLTLGGKTYKLVSVAAYETKFFEPHHFERFLVPAGLTGLWQVTARANSSFGEALDMDVAYARSWSLGLDLRLLCRTPHAVVRQTASTT